MLYLLAGLPAACPSLSPVCSTPPPYKNLLSCISSSLGWNKIRFIRFWLLHPVCLTPAVYVTWRLSGTRQLACFLPPGRNCFMSFLRGAVGLSSLSGDMVLPYPSFHGVWLSPSHFPMCVALFFPSCLSSPGIADFFHPSSTGMARQICGRREKNMRREDWCLLVKLELLI